MKNIWLFILMLFALTGHAQQRLLQFVNEFNDAIPFVRVRIEREIFFTDESGQIDLNIAVGKSVSVSAFSYRDSTFHIKGGDSLIVKLQKQNYLLPEITLIATEESPTSWEIKSSRPFSHSKDYQREIGECFLVKTPCQSCRVQSINLEVRQVFSTGAGLRLVIYNFQKELIAAGEVRLLPKDFKGPLELTLPNSPYLNSDSLLVGIEFIKVNGERSRSPRLISSFSIRGNRGLYTRKSNGITLLGFKVHKARRGFYLLSPLNQQQFLSAVGNGKYSYAPRLSITVEYRKDQD